MTVTAAVALDRLGPGALLSHQSAARALGLELVEPGGEHATVRRNQSRRAVPGWGVHRRDTRPDEVVVVDGVRVTGVVRTVHDLARSLPLGEALAVAESAVRLGRASEDEIRTALAASTGAWAERPRTVAALLAPADSVLESLAAAVFHEAGLSPRRQYDVSEPTGRHLATVDFCWPEAQLVVEVDGFAFHSDRDAYRRDRLRLNQLTRHHLRVLRFTYGEVRGQATLVVATITGTLRHPAACAH